MTFPSMEGAISIGIYRVFFTLYSMLSMFISACRHGVIVIVITVVNGKHLRRVFIQANSDRFDAGGSGGSGNCHSSYLF
jgi:hypothetical protein